MLNRYPLWKYIVLLIIIFISIIYALPNLYGEDPVVQVTGIHGISATKATLDKVQKILEKNKIQRKSMSIKNGVIVIRFANTNMQLQAHDAIINMLGEGYVVASNLYSATPNWLKKIGAKPIRFGLDLRGGVHFLIKVNMDTLLHKLQEENFNNLCSDLNQTHIPYVSAEKITNYGIDIGFQDHIYRDKAVKHLISRYRDLIFSKTKSDHLIVNISNERLNKERKYALQQDINILRNRVNQLGVSEPLVQRQGSDCIIVELPGIQDITRAKDILGSTATLEFRLVNTNLNKKIISNIPISIPRDSEVKHTRDGNPVILYKHVLLKGDHIIDSTSSIDEYNQLQVNISLDSTGGKIMSNITKDNIGKPMATLFVEYKDNGKKDANGRVILEKKEEIINVANIKSRFSSNFRITGINNLNEARRLSLLLKAGTLISPIQIIEEGTIGPTMGEENIHQGLKACVSGLMISILFMLFFYKKFGLIATSALLFNLILIIAIMSILPSTTLTMPGIAGIVLTLAVAVDANVLINERIKEELYNGYSIQQAIHRGYKKAFSSIFDANITTFIKVIILYTVGTSAIKGFAITTAIGIITSMFTAVIGTRAFVNLLYGGKRLNKISI